MAWSSSSSGGGGGGGEIEEQLAALGPGSASPAAGEIVPAHDDDDDDAGASRVINEGDVSKIYVAVGAGKSSEGAVAWALEKEATAWSVVYLVHVYPELRLIPTPLGMIPKERVGKAQLEKHMFQEQMKRQKMLQKFVEQCQLFGVKYEVELIESGQTVTAILEFIAAFEIKKLIIGTSRSKLRGWNKSKAGQIHKSAPEYCVVHVVCEGEEVAAAPDHIPASPTSTRTVKNYYKNHTEHDKNNEAVGKDKSKGIASCGCFSVG